MEVLSPTDRVGNTLRCIHESFDRGVPVVWLVDPEIRLVTGHRPGQQPVPAEKDDEVSAEDELSGCRFRVAEFFRFLGNTTAGEGSVGQP
ncbi:MAG: hypothetical protein ACFCD0_20550 [Gemmataceae bacterium]